VFRCRVRDVAIAMTSEPLPIEKMRQAAEAVEMLSEVREPFAENETCCLTVQGPRITCHSKHSDLSGRRACPQFVFASERPGEAHRQLDIR
jgi:hypothetical protein